MWGLPIGLCVGWFAYYCNVRFASYVTSRPGRHGGAVVLLVLGKYILILGTLTALAFGSIAAMLYGAAGIFAAMVGFAIYKSRKSMTE